MAVCAQEYAQSTIGLHQDDIIYSAAKMPFAYGLGNLYMPMAVGAASVLTDANNVFEIIADLNRYQPTVFFAIPAIYSGIWAVQEIAPLNTSFLRLCISAAEQLPKSVWRKWQSSFNLEICEGIGTSEFLHIFLSNRLGECRPGSCGKPVSGYDVRVVDDRGFDLPAGEIGNLQVEGASLMLQYWNRPSRTWVSRRIIDKPGKKAEAQRIEQAFFFKTMKIYWSYEELPQNVGTVMTRVQKFEPAEGAWPVEKIESFLNRNTRVQMQAIKEAVEAWSGKKEPATIAV